MLNGRTALISGSTGGIGHGTADALAAQGCQVMLNGFGDAAEIEATRAALEDKHGVKIGYHGADLRKLDELEDLVATTERELGPVDILVNNAVVRNFAPIEEFDPAVWQDALDVNLTSGFNLIRLTLGGMREARLRADRQSRVDARHHGDARPHRLHRDQDRPDGFGAWCRDRDAGRDRHHRQRDLPRRGPHPGGGDAGRRTLAESKSISLEAATKEFLAGRQPTDRFIEPAQVGALIAFLCSDAANVITGTSIPIDDAWTISP